MESPLKRPSVYYFHYIFSSSHFLQAPDERGNLFVLYSLFSFLKILVGSMICCVKRVREIPVFFLHIFFSLPRSGQAFFFKLFIDAGVNLSRLENVR